MSKPIFYNPNKLSVMSDSLVSIIGAINAAVEGQGAVCIRASKNNMSISFNGRVVAKGKNHREMHLQFKAAQQKAMEALKS